MKLEKAIEILTECLNVGTQEATPDVNDALRLGIGALKEFQKIREVHWDEIGWHTLPGETEI